MFLSVLLNYTMFRFFSLVFGILNPDFSIFSKSKNEAKYIFCWLVTSLLIKLQIIGLLTDRNRVKRVEQRRRLIGHSCRLFRRGTISLVNCVLYFIKMITVQLWQQQKYTFMNSLILPVFVVCYQL